MGVLCVALREEAKVQAGRRDQARGSRGGLVPEELEKHLILNSNRLKTFEELRLEIVTYVEAKFGLRIRDAKFGEAASRAQSDPMDVAAVNSLVTGKGKLSTAAYGGCFTINATAVHTKARASNPLARAYHGRIVRSKEKVKKQWKI